MWPPISDFRLLTADTFDTPSFPADSWQIRAVTGSCPFLFERVTRSRLAPVPSSRFGFNPARSFSRAALRQGQACRDFLTIAGTSPVPSGRYHIDLSVFGNCRGSRAHSSLSFWHAVFEFVSTDGRPATNSKTACQNESDECARD